MAQQVRSSMTRDGGSIKSVSRDTESLSSSVNETAAAIEEMTGSIQIGLGGCRRSGRRGGRDGIVDQ